MNKSCGLTHIPQGMTEAQKERAVRANEVYCRACEESGVKGCSPEDFSAWRDFVDGKISESRLYEEASGKLRDLSKAFGKYAVLVKEGPGGVELEASRRERAKLAAKIYRKACADEGQSHCFFKDFASWSDYMEGNIGELDLYLKGRMEAAKAAAAS